MDSTTTLVNPVPSTELIFDQDSVLNAKILINSSPAYLITSTETLTNCHTEIQDLRTHEVVATLDQKVISALSKITVSHVNGGKSMKLKEWLKSSTDDERYPVHVIETEYGDFTWKIDPVHRLKLYRNGQPDSPLAYMKVGSGDAPIVLIIENEVIGFTDRIIASWIILERKLRSGETSARNASGRALEASGPQFGVKASWQ